MGSLFAVYPALQYVNFRMSGCRYYLQVDHATQNPILHRKSDSTLCGPDIPNRFGLLLAKRFGREGKRFRNFGWVQDDSSIVCF